MTQALINSLNITEKTLSLADKMPKADNLDFGKIFETKTKKENVSGNDTNQKSNKSVKNDKHQDSFKNETDTDKNAKTDNQINTDLFSTVFNRRRSGASKAPVNPSKERAGPVT